MRAAQALAATCGLLALALPLSGATHGDGVYDQPVWFTWDRATLDVLILLPLHGQVVNGNGVLNGGDPAELTPFNSYTQAVQEGIGAWRTGIDAFGAPWLRDGVRLNLYMPGVDLLPPEGYGAVDVVFATDEYKGSTLGLAVHADPCLVLVSKFYTQSFSATDMYTIAGQEFGHCLGLEHVAGGHPVHDVMNGNYPWVPGDPTAFRHCVSNLNIRGLESVFGDLFGHPGGGTATTTTDTYQAIAC